MELMRRLRRWGSRPILDESQSDVWPAPYDITLYEHIDAPQEDGQDEGLPEDLMELPNTYCFIPPDILQHLGLDNDPDILPEIQEETFRIKPADGSLHSPKSQEPRPPLYNAEMYALGLRRWGRKGGTRQYIEGREGPERHGQRDRKRRDSKAERAARQEMGMRQFANVSDLLKKLRQDLRMSYPSFVREFVTDPYDGVTGLLDLLKMIQLSQTDYAASMNGTLRSKEHHNFFRRALTDEYDCLLCLKHCLRCEETAAKLVGYSHGLYTVAVCIMSNFSKSRTLALELLTVACETRPRGHQQVMEAASTLRLRFGEPVRFKFLVGMLTSFGAPR
ncbi:uncharacterized protein LOC119095191 [Pollicipes pollicipes]|uniref:uncharacterized protein LOC119095191 n=1 Tax=Pollicipes pollicipes TaxID=41117 RepID=UPI0018849D0B|nr:uncharacterized protein LOC119095191 [Pollicipes pollicipes]